MHRERQVNDRRLVVLLLVGQKVLDMPEPMDRVDSNNHDHHRRQPPKQQQG